MTAPSEGPKGPVVKIQLPTDEASKIVLRFRWVLPFALLPWFLGAWARRRLEALATDLMIVGMKTTLQALLAAQKPPAEMDWGGMPGQQTSPPREGTPV